MSKKPERRIEATAICRCLYSLFDFPVGVNSPVVFTPLETLTPTESRHQAVSDSSATGSAEASNGLPDQAVNHPVRVADAHHHRDAHKPLSFADFGGEGMIESRRANVLGQ